MTEKSMVNKLLDIKIIVKIFNFEKYIDFKHWYYNETWIIFNKEMIEIIIK